MREELQEFKKIVLEILKKEKYNSKSNMKYTLKIILELYEIIENQQKELELKERQVNKAIENTNYWKKEAKKPDMTLVNANTKLVDKNNLLKRDIKLFEENNKKLKTIILSKKIKLTEDEKEILSEIGD